MTNRLSLRTFLAISLCAALVPLLRAEKAEEGWAPLFNGKNLDNWVQHNGTAAYRIDGDCIVGKTSEGSPNSFLCTIKDYADFELKFEVKVDDELNSGVQIRSQSKKDVDKGRVRGPQVEIAVNGDAGFIYGEGLGTGWVTDKRDDPKARAAFKKGEWNMYRVLAQGKSIKTWINDVQITETIDDKTGMSSGFIGLQVHGIPKDKGPYEVRFRNLFIKELK
jgi:Domain of Unknown Function (DUF1080)